VIDDKSVSKIHAALAADAAGELTVADTGSTNGTFINDQRISYGKATRLVDGDRVKFGMVEVVFEHIQRPPDTEPAFSTKDVSKDDTTAIDGFEFTGRASAETPADTTMDEQTPAETQEIDPPVAEGIKDKGSTAESSAKGSYVVKKTGADSSG
jgi:pSer/pThr/pTyr-binding forkhead associated (FHA) protein